MGIELVTIVIGSVMPLIIGYLRRWVNPTRVQIQLIIIILTIALLLLADFFNGGLTKENMVQRVVVAYATSQLVYQTVIKSLDIDQKLEGKD